MTDASIANDLATVRDWLRYATSRFRKADLVFGHGTSSAIDEAAFLILKTLDLPVDQLDPWLDCRLTLPERQSVLAIIEKRVSTRKPASYLVNEAFIRGHSFYVDERVIVPRSFIGELLEDGIETAVSDADSIETVLDLCTGSGCLAILAAIEFPNAMIDAADLSNDALDVAKRNVADYGFEDRVNLIRSDLFDAMPGKRYDLIISNPPYVAQEAVDDFPPEYRAEPVMAHAGGEDGLDIVRRILGTAANHLTPDGVLVVEIGTGLDILEAEFPDLPFLWLDTEDSDGEVFALTAREFRAAQGKPRSGREKR